MPGGNTPIGLAAQHGALNTKQSKSKLMTLKCVALSDAIWTFKASGIAALPVQRPASTGKAQSFPSNGSLVDAGGDRGQ